MARKTSKAFVINDYKNKKRFASFLPSISGYDGKPMWVFYANVGQSISSFGVGAKENPLLPFDSAYLAYSNIELRCFRTMVYVDDEVYQPFLDEGKYDLTINRSQISIQTENEQFAITIQYSTVSRRPYPGLLRKVMIKNKGSERFFRVIDGLPIFLPKGISNYAYKNLTTLMAAYCKCENLEKNAPWMTSTNRGEDEAKIVAKIDGTGYFTLDCENQKARPIVDAKLLFKDETLLKPRDIADINKDLERQVTVNQIPAAFSKLEKKLKKGESLEFISLFTAMDSLKDFNDVAKSLTYEELNSMFEETDELVESLLPEIKTSNEDLDEYFKQSYFDNSLRGGFPIYIDDKVLYLYSRKHGDMERDYNDFKIPSTYFSSGLGNFRDINQNRRNDLLFEPRIKDSNIFLFFSLIEANGYNPLLVDVSLLNRDYKSYEEAKKAIHSLDTNAIKANYGEGYWIDHWVYNIDLIENYLSIYPDKKKELLSRDDYRFFDSGKRLKPRKERYVKTDNSIRQYGAIEDADSERHDWLRKDGKIITVNLASKIFDLIIKKYANLDVNQMGIEMNADKPGWNDSCNGLPGLFASSMNETIELLRLIKLYRSLIDEVEVEVKLIKQSHLLLQNLLSLEGEGFEYWNKMNQYREDFEDSYRTNNDLSVVDKKTLREALDRFAKVLEKGIQESKKYTNGIIPTYFIQEAKDYKEEDGKIVIDGFTTTALPLFLEAPARELKLGKDSCPEKEIKAIEQSALFDKKLKIFKTSEPLANVSNEIGRIKSFFPGWLERESDFLHMTFKYLLGLLSAGYYEEFLRYAKTNIPCFMEPEVYGRSIYENVSFIVPSNHPDKSQHGTGHYARLTGANAEIINMYQLLFFGKDVFKMTKGKLTLNLKPHIPLSLFKDGKIEATLLQTKFIFINRTGSDYNEQMVRHYEINGEKYAEISGQLAEDIRNLKIKEITAIL